MCKNILFLAFTLFLSCGSSKTDCSKIAFSTNQCPDKGECSIEIFKGKDLNITIYDNNSMGYDQVDAENKTIVRYEFKKNMKQMAHDGGYREEVIFVIDSNTDLKNLKDEQLQQTKMLYGRYCYCRGQTGLYKVKKGNLQIVSSNDNVHFNLDFTIDEVPQIIKNIAVKNSKLISD
jgi:hypothetical protein